MTCPADVAVVLLEIMKTGLNRIRTLGWAREPDRCAVEADHIHNLPDLLRNFSPDLLRFYWDTERTAFISQSSASDLASFEPLWGRLAGHVNSGASRSLAP